MADSAKSCEYQELNNKSTVPPGLGDRFKEHPKNEVTPMGMLTKETWWKTKVKRSKESKDKRNSAAAAMQTKSKKKETEDKEIRFVVHRNLVAS